MDCVERLLEHAQHHLSKRNQNPELALMYVRDAIALAEQQAARIVELERDEPPAAV